MRVIGGLVMLVVGMSSLTTGGCEVVAGSASPSAPGLVRAFETDGRAMDPEVRKQLTVADAAGPAVLVSGVLVTLAGALAAVAGVLLLLNRGRRWVLVASGFGVLAEILHWVLVAFYVFGLIKIVCYAFVALAATNIRRPEEAS